MNTKPVFPILGIFLLLAVSLACNLSGVALTSEPDISQLAPTETQTVEGMVVSFQGTSFTIPKGLAGGASTQSTTDFELPFTNPGYGDMPEHLKFTLENYALQGRSAYIAIFPADAYAKYSDGTAQAVGALKALPESVGELTSPLLQYGFYARAKVVPFQNGRGLRYLTQVMQAPLPINNAEMIYWFTALTSDGKFYISAVFPASATFLQADGNPATTVPADGVPFPSAFDVTQITQYFDQVQKKLNSAEASSFTPSLESLDALAGSISVVEP